MKLRPTHPFLVAQIALLASATASWSKDVKYQDLPGVDLDYSIVKPDPEPDQADRPVTDQDGFVTIGNTRVKVSGMIRFDYDYVSKNKK